MGLPTDPSAQPPAEDYPYPSNIALPPSRTNTFESPAESPSRPSTDAESQRELASRHRPKRSVDAREDRLTDSQVSPSRDRSRPNGKQSNRICAKCGGHLTGQFVRALGDTYHLECFTCHVCRFHNPSPISFTDPPRTAVKSSLPSSSLYPNNHRINTRCAKRTISADWICSATHVEAPSEAHTSLLWIENTTLNISPVPCVPQYLAPKIATMNTRAMSIVITIIQRSSPSAAMAVRRLSSSNLSKSFAMVRINTGTRNVT